MSKDPTPPPPAFDGSQPGSNGAHGEADEWKHLVHKAYLAMHAGNHEEAMSLAREIMQGAAKLGEADSRYWTALRLLAEVHFAKRELEESEKYYTNYLLVCKVDESAEMLEVLIALAAVQISNGKAAEAAFSIQRALLRVRRRRDVYELINRRFGRLQDELDKAQFAATRRVPEIYQRVCEAVARALGHDATEYGAALGNWGIALHLLGKDAEAEPKLKEAIALLQTKHLPRQDNITYQEGQLNAQADSKQDQADVHAGHLQDVHDPVQDVSGARLDLARYLENLAEIYSAQGQKERALDCRERATALRSPSKE